MKSNASANELCDDNQAKARNESTADLEVDNSTLKKRSLLDAVRESYEANKNLRCTRVLYIGHCHSQQQQELVRQIHVEFMAKEYNKEKISGALLFIGSNYFYHMLEAPSLEIVQPLFDTLIYDQQQSFLQALNRAQCVASHPQLKGLQVKICCVSEDIAREFPIWSMRDVEVLGGNRDNAKTQKEKKANDEQDITEDQTALQNLLFETMKAMIEIGRQLFMKQDSDAALKLFQSSQREIMSRFPTADKIEFFLESKLLFDLAAFKQYFFSPINLKLESEQTWPIEPMISF